MTARIYLDYNATAPMDPTVRRAMSAAARRARGNPASAHWAGHESRDAVEEARASVARLIGATPEEIYFTSGGTEADNLAVLGAMELASATRRQLVTSSIEHPAVGEACERAEHLGWATVRRLVVSARGTVDVPSLRAALDVPTRLVSIMLVNNVTGAVQDVPRLAALAREAGALVHTDAVQAAGKVPIDVDRLGVDLVSLSSHKIHGPTGVGALYVRTGVALSSQAVGGGHERGLRSGSLNTLGIVGFGAAARLAAERLDETRSHSRALRDRLCAELLGTSGACRLLSDPEVAVSSTVTLSFPDVRADAIVQMLSLRGVAVSQCSACSAHDDAVDCPPLVAMGLPIEVVRGAVRFSFGLPTTLADVTRAARIVNEVVERLRRIAGGRTRRWDREEVVHDRIHQ